MAKPNKVRYSGVMVLANGYPLSRVQNVNISSDLGVEEVKELSNTEVVEYTSTQPNVTISLETNEYGSCRNLRAILGVTGGTAAANGADSLTITGQFEFSHPDITLLVKEDTTLARSCIVQDAYLTSVAWNYDVGGVATETFNFEADNKSWFTGAKKEAVSVMGITSTVVVDAGKVSCVFPMDTGSWTPLRIYQDGTAISGGCVLATCTGYTMFGETVGWVNASGFDSNVTTTGTSYKLFGFKASPDGATFTFNTSTSSIGSIPRGRLNLYLTSGAGDTMTIGAATNALRLQTVSISMELAREPLNQLGFYKAYERALTYPVPVNITFSALASDIEEFGKFQGLPTSTTEYNLDDFLKVAKLRIEIYNKNDTELTGRTLLKSILITGVQVVSEAFSVDVGGNATQEFTTKANNILISGVGFCNRNTLSSGLSYTD